MTLTNLKTGQAELVWKKLPYPENWSFMYGMSHFNLQFNYLPNHLRPHLPPTDCRFRPDQKALENGDFKLAAEEKNRLEDKQRAIRKYREKNKIENKPAYFEEWRNPEDPEQTYYRYNGKYWEQDRMKKDWSRLPDLYSDKMPPSEVEEAAGVTQKKKK